MTKTRFVSLFLVPVIFSVSTVVFAEEAKESEKLPEKLFSEEYGRVYDATLAVVTEKGFSVHPHKNMSADKEKGRIKTSEWRYFKIWSAKPVIEKQYKDSYKLDVTKIQIETPQPSGGTKKEGETPAAPAATPGEKPAVAPGEKAVEGAAAGAPVPVPTITKVKVSIKRDFLVHNDETRAWEKGDPAKEKAGYSEEDFFKAIEEKLKEQSPAVDAAKQANLNITPPPTLSASKP